MQSCVRKGVRKPAWKTIFDSMKYNFVICKTLSSIISLRTTGSRCYFVGGGQWSIYIDLGLGELLDRNCHIDLHAKKKGEREEEEEKGDFLKLNTGSYIKLNLMSRYKRKRPSKLWAARHLFLELWNMEKEVDGFCHFEHWPIHSRKWDLKSWTIARWPCESF